MVCKIILVLVAVLLGMDSVAMAQALASADSSVSRSGKIASAVDKLSAAIQFKTVSRVEQEEVEYKEFKALHTYLYEAFPLVHRQLEMDVVNEYSLLYTWHGSDSTLKPLLFSAHLDVVPVEKASLEEWEYDPFSGYVENGYIWGRGTMDDKYRVIAILQAVEQLLQSGFRPERTVLLAFGHDEETGGREGAGEISALLSARGIALAAVFDEGLAVTEKLMPGITKPVAFVGTASKGNISYLLRVNGEGGHSSVPPSETPIAVLSEAIYRINQHPFEPRLTPAIRQTLEVLSNEMGGLYRFSMNFYGLTKGMIKKRLAKNQATDALIRTKTAPTIIQAGDKFNVLPREATAVLNVRILTGETDESVLAYLKRVINDERVQIEQYGVYTPPSPVTPTDTWLYKSLETTILQTFPDALVAPALFPGATDARYYTNLTENIFLFAPQVVTPTNATLVHNVNERLSVDVLERSIVFYHTLIQQISGQGGK